jgi:hypothetical protein
LAERIVAVGLLTQREVELLGHGFSRLWPIDETPCFTDLVKAIDEADLQLKTEHEQSLEVDGRISGGGY